MKLTACYYRVSTGTQNLSMQRIAVRERCRVARWKLVKEYEDKASASTRACVALDALMRDVSDGKVARVVVHSLDRLGRSSAHMALLWEQLKKHGAELVSIRDNLDTASNGAAAEIVFSVMSALANVERQRIRSRVKDGISAARKRGVTFGRPRMPAQFRADAVALAKKIGLRAAARQLKIAPATICNFRKERKPAKSPKLKA